MRSYARNPGSSLTDSRRGCRGCRVERLSAGAFALRASQSQKHQCFGAAVSVWTCSLPAFPAQGGDGGTHGTGDRIAVRSRFPHPYPFSWLSGRRKGYDPPIPLCSRSPNSACPHLVEIDRPMPGFAYFRAANAASRSRCGTDPACSLSGLRSPACGVKGLAAISDVDAQASLGHIGEGAGRASQESGRRELRAGARRGQDPGVQHRHAVAKPRQHARPAPIAPEERDGTRCRALSWQGLPPHQPALTRRPGEPKRFARVVRLWRRSFKSALALGGVRQVQHMYNAHCAAALAAATMSPPLNPSSPLRLFPPSRGRAHKAPPPVPGGQRRGAEGPAADAERASLRNQALAWLRTELEIWTRLLESTNANERGDRTHPQSRAPYRRRPRLGA